MQVAMSLVDMVKRVVKRQRNLTGRIDAAREAAAAADFKSHTIGSKVSDFCSRWDAQPFLPTHGMACSCRNQYKVNRACC